MNDLRLAFYGDDFTGSTDAMDALSKAGVDTVLFLETVPPGVIEQEFSDVNAIGLAGTSRSMSPEEMEEELPEQLSTLEALNPPLIHYKVCSTFDSAPDVGSIGRAIDIGMDLFESDTVPLLPGAPPLGRYVVFGNMFASDGDEIHRLDRHPTMSEHPVTPMKESNLLKHLAEQTEKSRGLIDVLDLNGPESELQATFEQRLRNGEEIQVFDSLSDHHLRLAGELIWEHAEKNRSQPTFAVGSSGLEYGLTRHWEAERNLDGDREYGPLDPVDTTLVMSGSASPLTASQIQTALDNGFTGIRIQTSELIGPEGSRELVRVTDSIVDELRADNSVVAFTARGPDDPAISRTKEVHSGLDDPPENVGEFIGKKQGEIMRDALTDVELDRVCVAGGDTCGFVTPLLDIYALEVLFPLAPGSPVCNASAHTARFDSIEIALKGGQLGHEEYFVDLEQGTAE